MHEFLRYSASHGNVPSSADCRVLCGRPSLYVLRRTETDLPDSVKRARQHLREAGWSYRTAAPVLRVHWSHLAQVLTGRRKSDRLCEAVLSLPIRAAA